MKLTDTQKLDKLLVLIDLLNMEIKAMRKLIIDTQKERANDTLSDS